MISLVVIVGYGGVNLHKEIARVQSNLYIDFISEKDEDTISESKR